MGKEKKNSLVLEEPRHNIGYVLNCIQQNFNF